MPRRAGHRNWFPYAAVRRNIGDVVHILLHLERKHGRRYVSELLRVRSFDPDSDSFQTPNYIVNTSPDKWQVLWRVEGFEKSQAEDLQRGMVREFGADPAATDCSRVLRVPGFYNHKYSRPHYVRAVELTRKIYTPEHFPKLESEDRAARSARIERDPATGLSQSERDWAYARRALTRGESPEAVTAAIAQYRRDEKVNVIDYAERTVGKAAASLEIESSSQPDR
ncbi:MAG: RepB family DNA primase [Bryobacteraceae bacterium]|nr:RepB family DNA primase [Bryobacteraceae bacterium]